jgi:hypothetical protein
MSTRDIMGNIQSFHEKRQGGTLLDEVESCLINEEQLSFFPQEECEDDVYHVQCYHCDGMIDPNESPVYCWNLGHQGQIFCCGGCDAENRSNYSITLKVREALKEARNG